MDLVKLFSKREVLQRLISEEYAFYRNAIKTRKPTDISSASYERLKFMEKKIQDVSNEIRKHLKLGN